MCKDKRKNLKISSESKELLTELKTIYKLRTYNDLILFLYQTISDKSKKPM